jgi:leukotriene-A4 hydrolase
MRIDPHSYTDDAQAQVTALDWEARVDFARRTLDATATLLLDRGTTGDLDLDTRGLTVLTAHDDSGLPVDFTLHPEEPILGARLTLHLPRTTQSVTLVYRTAPDASALQWLDPAQTAGGAQPFLFSQCQAIHARSVVPLQDTPQRRITFHATLTVPSALRGLMAAGHDGPHRVGRHGHGGVAHAAAHRAVPLRLRRGRARSARARPPLAGVGRTVRRRRRGLGVCRGRQDA